MKMMKRFSSLFLVLSFAVSNLAINTTALTFEEEMAAKGFPQSYITYLSALHNDHPHWQFEPVLITEMEPQYTFDYVVSKEDVIAGNSARNLVTTGTWAPQPWTALGQANYTPYYDSTDTTLYDSGWRKASNAAVRYFMDPRNFLNDVDVFMFETMEYVPEVHTLELINTTLGSSFMGSYAMCDNGITYAQHILNCGAENNTSPVALAGRLRQEQGLGGSPLVEGTLGSRLYYYYTEKPDTDGGDPVWGDITKDHIFDPNVLLSYDGYYNFFNIGASGNGRFAIFYNAAQESIAGGWNTRAKAIAGGTKKFADMYVNQYQDTLYFQKFNTDPRSSKNFWGQYMQNIAAAVNEGRNARNTYKNAGILELPFVFKIPVYGGMPETPCADPAGGNSYYSPSASTGTDYGTNVYPLDAVVVEGKGVVHFGNYVTSVPINAGTLVHFQTTPDAGYKVSSIFVNGKSVEIQNNGGDCVYTFISTPQSTTVSVSFERNYPDVSVTAYRIRCGSFDVKANAENYVNTLKNAGFDAFLEEKNSSYYVYGGSYFDRETANAAVAQIKAAGFDCYITTAEVNQVATAIVTLNSLGAQSVGTDSVYAAKNSILPDITIPQKNGNKFMGYYTGENGTGICYYDENGTALSNYQSEGDSTLYARFDPYYTVNHYIQNIDGKASLKDADNYTLTDSAAFSNALGVSVTPSLNKYSMRVAPMSVTVIPADDGSTVVNYFYRLRYGDIDTDDTVTAADVVALKIRILTDKSSDSQLAEVVSDVNGDGVIDLKDLLRLKLFMANENTIVGS